MKSLLWKELHETARWAALPLLLFGGIMAVYGPRPCINEQFLLLVSVVGAVFGGALGYLQVASEARGDRRALLLHRPLSRSRIFLAKAIAGATIYLVALGFPFVVNAILAAMPGQIAEPFRWAALLPWLADILTGLVYFFGGMLAAQRPGRWYVSRCLGFPACFVASLLEWNVPEFWQALAAVVVIGGLLAVAAWGSFLAGGEYQPQPLIAKAALAFALLISVMEIGIDAKSMLGFFLADHTGRYYNVDLNGRVVVVHHLPNREMRVTDREGRDLPEFEPKDLASNEALSERMATFSTGSPFRWKSYRIPGRLFVPCANGSTPRGESWFFVVDRGRLVGYDSRKRLIGSIGPEGFALASEPGAERFEGPLFFSTSPRMAFSPDYLAFPVGVFTVDFRQREVTKLFTPAAGETVLWATRWWSHKPDESLAFVCTDHSVHVLDEAGKQVLSAPLAYDPWEYGDVRLRRLESPLRYMISYAPGLQPGIVPRQTLPLHFIEYDDTGNQLAHQTVPALPWAKISRWQAWFGLVTSPGELAVLFAATHEQLFGTPASAGCELDPLAYFTLNKALGFVPDALQMQFGLRSSAVAAYLALSLLTAAICSALCYFLACRYAFSRLRRLGWAVLGLLFGPAGLLVMLAMQQWPARIVCHACGKRRVVDRDWCERCGAPHALPVPDGTEVFESTPDLLPAMSPSS